MATVAGSLTDAAWDRAIEHAATSFVPDDVLAALDGGGGLPERGDLAAIELDDDGTVVACNRAAGELLRLPSSSMPGHGLFTEVAPCTDNRLFRGTFRRARHLDEVDLVFGYTLTYRIPPTDVLVHLRRRDGRTWLLLAPG
jgi:photoactive yellow protein